MKIKNVSTSNIIIPEIKDAQGSGLLLSPGAEVEIYDEDAERSSTLATYLTQGLITKTGTSEPLDGTGVGDTDVAAMAAMVPALTATIASLQGDVASLQSDVMDLTQRILDLEASN